MAILSALFNYELNQSSPVKEETIRVVNYDEDGNELITYQKFDSAKFQKSLGSVNDWNLNTLLKAGINPDFPIHTTNPTAIEGLGSVEQWSMAADSVFAEQTPGPKE